MGLATRVAGVLYVGVGRLQEVPGLTTALSVTFLVQMHAAAITPR